MHLQILDLDGALAAQTTLRTIAPWQSVSTVDLRDLGPRLRLWSRDRTIRFARERIAARAPDGPTLHLLGSGDFHHLAAVLIERARAPVTVVHIDNHPDWVRLAPRWHCGSWVNQALRLPQVERVITLGVCSDDLVRPDLKGGNLPALASGKLVLFPWEHAPSRVWRRIPDGPGRRWENGHIHWKNMAESGVENALNAIIPLICTDAVWFSIDKDVLDERAALTNWDQGRMPLPALLDIVAAVGARKRIVGADVCGEYSPIAHTNWFKRWEARADQPQREADAAMLARNEATNRELLMAIEMAARC
ncbi:MAG: arginase [Proteobacteria bacterium]|nr:arginase [Pseudomonadota bacterium]